MPAPGDVLDGKWRIERVVGEGGMGVVFAATHVRHSRRAAIKVLNEVAAQDAQTRARFQTEGYIANQIDHPGTLQVLDDGVTADGLPYLVMEFLEGESLEAMAERSGGTLGLDVLAPLVDRALEVLAAAHAKRIVHRDIKPANLFVTRDGSVKLLDFGIAKVDDAPTSAKLTTNSVAMGTPAFMPPEQALACWQDVDARSDVFSVCASLWVLLTGRLLFEARTPSELMVFMSTKQAPLISAALPALPRPITDVIDRGLCFERMQRFADAGELLAAWQDACRHVGLLAGPTPHAIARAPLDGLGATVAVRPVAASLATEADVTTRGETARGSRSWVLVAGSIGAAAIAGALLWISASGVSQPAATAPVPSREQPRATAAEPPEVEPSDASTPASQPSGAPVVTVVPGPPAPVAKPATPASGAPKPSAPKPAPSPDPFRF